MPFAKVEKISRKLKVRGLRKLVKLQLGILIFSLSTVSSILAEPLRLGVVRVIVSNSSAPTATLAEFNEYTRDVFDLGETFNIASNGIVQVSNDILSLGEVTIDSFPDNCYDQWQEEVDLKLASYGIDISTLDTMIYLVPPNQNCAFGFAKVEERKVTLFYPDPGLLSHELGHVLGLGHAGLDSDDNGVVDYSYEYGNALCAMGSGAAYQRNSKQIVDFSPAHPQVRSWMKSSGETFPVLKSVGEFDLSLPSYHDGPSSKPRVIVIQRNHVEEVVIEYRGKNALGATRFNNRLLISKVKQSERLPLTRLVKLLKPGQAYFDAINKYSVRFLGIKNGMALTKIFLLDKKKKSSLSVSFVKKKPFETKTDIKKVEVIVKGGSDKTLIQCRSLFSYGRTFSGEQALPFPDWKSVSSISSSRNRKASCPIKTEYAGEYKIQVRAIEGEEATKPSEIIVTRIGE